MPARFAFATDAVLRDGSSARLRAAGPEDSEAVARIVAEAGDRALEERFYRGRDGRPAGGPREVLAAEPARHATLVVEAGRPGGERVIGAGRYLPGEDGVDGRAEVILVVARSERGRGIGTVLLEQLIRLARAHGIGEFRADVVGDTQRVLEVFERSGLALRRWEGAGRARVAFATALSDDLMAASLRREGKAVAESLRPLLAPGSLAVVGASRSPGTIGHQHVVNLRKFGYTGEVFLVNPKAEEILGYRCYPSVTAIGRPFDLAIIAVPAPAVEGVLVECAALGVRGACVISAGFAEVSPEGRSAQRRLRDVARKAGMRLIGPNCMGLANTDPAISLNGTFAPVYPPAGNVGFLSQSGALGLAVLDYAKTLNIGVSTFVSAGNKADVSANDLLCYWRDDPRTGVIGLYLESFGDPRKFARLARDIAREKPIVAVKSGRSAAGTRAASSHSAALAALDVAVEALFEQAGVIRTDTLEELFDVVTLFASQPIPRGPRVGVVTNAGGPGILLADACEARGLSLPPLADGTLAALREFLPATAGLSNPIDMIAAAGPAEYRQAVAVVGNDPQVDALVVLYVPPLATQPEEIAAAIAEAAGEVPAHKPVLSVFLSSRGVPDVLRSGPRGALPSFSFPENAAQALGAAVRYGRWLARPEGRALRLEGFARDTVRQVVARALEGVAEPVWLAAADTATVLRAAGIEIAAAQAVPPAEAAAAAERMGFPLVAKAVAPGLVHKSDAGGVVLGLGSREQVEDAVGRMRERVAQAGYRLEGVVLQREIRGGIEAMVGVTVDDVFGPLVVAGIGGVLVELLRDAQFRVPPVTEVDAAEMVGRLRMGRLLDGYRGAAPGDRRALIETIRRVSALAEALPELREMDLNPVKVLPPGQGAIAVDARIRVGPALPLDD
jgi:acetyl coenzyme A synthetase (ADP forming)-like protein